MRASFTRFGAPALLLVFAQGVAAQSFADFCPEGDEETQAAVVGYVMDDEGETTIPMATVAASWVADNMRQRAEADADLTGLYVLCGLPKEMEVSLRALLGNRRGEAIPYTTAAAVAQQDLAISLADDDEGSNPREEVGSLTAGGEGGRGRAFSAEIIRAEDLLHLPEMSVYELLRQHQMLRVERSRVGGGDIIVLTTATTGRQGMTVRIDERREADGLSAMRDLSIDDVSRIEILSRTEASARYGGDGYIGAIAITTRRP